MFDSTKKDLRDILKRVDEGRIQLPDFQREYVWGDSDVRSLIASIVKGFPVGALLTLQAGSEVAFKPRLLAGVPEKSTPHEELLLDGQQRITSLYQAMYSPAPVQTLIRNNREALRYYYLDMKKAIGDRADVLDAIVPVPEDRVIRSNFGKDVELDLSKPELEYTHDMFPLNRIFESKYWFHGWRDYWIERGRETHNIERDFDLQVIDSVNRYMMPIIQLDRTNSREAICLVFEKVNVGGKKLDAFELLTAIYAADSFDLREEWRGNGKRIGGLKKRLIGGDYPRRVLKKIQNTDYLQACTLLHTMEVRAQKADQGYKGLELPQISCNRQALLGLPLHAYRKYTETVEKGFIDAAAFLTELRIMSQWDLPYPQQVSALASVFAILGRHAHNAVAKEKLTRWFWCGALGELYGSGGESRMARDVPAIVEWIANNGPPPPTIDDAVFRQNRLLSLRSRKSAAYKAIHALLMAYGCRDFVTGDTVEIMTYFERDIDIHHIFPQKWCKARKIEERLYDCIVNKTPLSKGSNIRVGGDAPSMYLKRIQDKDGIPETMLDDILTSHQISPALLRENDFEAFFNHRMDALSELIGRAMGKTVVSGQSDEDDWGDDLDEEEDLEAETVSAGD